MIWGGVIGMHVPTGCFDLATLPLDGRRNGTQPSLSVPSGTLLGMDDERLMSAEQQRLLRTIVEAINEGVDIYGAVRRLPMAEPDKREMAAILAILRNPDIGFRHGDDPEIVLARILKLLAAHAEDTKERSGPGLGVRGRFGRTVLCSSDADTRRELA